MEHRYGRQTRTCTLLRLNNVSLSSLPLRVPRTEAFRRYSERKMVYTARAVKEGIPIHLR